jgi:3D (Asp-Asp-Asp) domain-containing protein
MGMTQLVELRIMEDLRVIPLQTVVAVREVDVGFVEDGGPLERCG